MSVIVERVFLGLVAVVAGLLIAGCASVPDESPPQWAVSPPSDNKNRLYFVVSGDSPHEAGDHMAAAVIERFSLGAGAKMDSAPISRLREELSAAPAAARENAGGNAGTDK